MRGFQAEMDSVEGSFTKDTSKTRCVYISVPITSGRRYTEWLRRRGYSLADVDSAATEYQDDYYENVVVPNRLAARSLVGRWRVMTSRPIIDPTSLQHVPHWQQKEWLSFCDALIRRYAAAVVFAEDWQFSFGCTYEYRCAYSLGVPSFDEKGSLLSLDRGLALIRGAILELKGIADSAQRLRDIANGLLDSRDHGMPAAHLQLTLLQQQGVFNDANRAFQP